MTTIVKNDGLSQLQGTGYSSPLTPQNSRNWRKVWWERRRKAVRPSRTWVPWRTRAMYNGGSQATSNPHTYFVWFTQCQKNFLIGCQHLKIRRYLLNFVVSGLPWKIRSVGSTGSACSHGSRLSSAEWQWLHWIRYTSPVSSIPSPPFPSLCYTHAMYTIVTFP